uniref:Ig-like domain-containing protein n=2 Tax=unclassified Pseudomonas TaxID=196821 RepID=UPI000A1EE1E0
SAGKDVVFTLSAAFVQQHFEARRGETLTASYSIRRAETGKVSYSNPLTFVIGVALQLQPPRIQQAEADGQTLQPVKAKDALTAVIPAEGLQPADLLSVTWQGAPGSHAEGSHTTEAKPISQSGYSIALPPTVLAFALGKTVTVTYRIERGGKVFDSPPLSLKVGTLPATALNSPVITDADAGNVLDLAALGSKDVTIRAQDWALIATGQQVWMSLLGRKADGAAHDLTVWNGGASYVNATWFQQKYWNRSVANSYFKALADGSQLTLKFKAALDKSNVAANAVVFADRVYTVKAVPLVVPTLTNVLDANNVEVPEGTYTVSTTLTLKGTASKGLQVEVYDGNGSTAVSKGKATADATTGRWELKISVPVGARRLYAKSLYHSTATYSNVRLLTVTSPMSIDPSPMTLNGFALVTPTGWEVNPAYDFPGNTSTRTPKTGIPPYTYSSANPAIAKVSNTGKVEGLQNGRTVISVRDASGQTREYSVTVSNVYRLVTRDTTLAGNTATLWASLGWVRITQAHALSFAKRYQPPYERYFPTHITYRDGVALGPLVVFDGWCYEFAPIMYPQFLWRSEASACTSGNNTAQMWGLLPTP